MSSLTKLAGCSIEGCEEPSYCRTWCRMHYARWVRHGDPNRARLSTEERLWRNIDRRGPDECWPFKKPNSRGYGRMKIGDFYACAHRVAYELTIGPIPEGMTLDHVCHTKDTSCAGGPECPHRACCNPAHLEPVTQFENVHRGRGLAAANARKTHCKWGHPISDPIDFYLVATDHQRYRRVCVVCSAMHSKRANTKTRLAKVLAK